MFGAVEVDYLSMNAGFKACQCALRRDQVCSLQSLNDLIKKSKCKAFFLMDYSERKLATHSDLDCFLIGLQNALIYIFNIGMVRVKVDFGSYTQT